MGECTINKLQSEGGGQRFDHMHVATGGLRACPPGNFAFLLLCFWCIANILSILVIINIIILCVQYLSLQIQGEGGKLSIGRVPTIDPSQIKLWGYSYCHSNSEHPDLLDRAALQRQSSLSLRLE